jgi:ATP-dependent protease ClpP protease subunit
MSRQWYSFAAKAEDKSAELVIFGDIGSSYWDDDAVSAKQFLDDLKALPASVAALTVRVNSLGGSVFDGFAIANALRTWARAQEGRAVTTVVEGIAASAASLVIMAGGTIKVADNALVMIHNAWTFAIGNAAEMRKIADALDKIGAGIVATYKWHTSLSDEEIQALLDAETWMTADEAIAKGFATEKVEGLKAAASLDRRAFAKLAVPEQHRSQVQALLKPEPAKPVAAAALDVVRLCREGECPELAEGLLEANATADQVQARIAAERTARTERQARATEITAVCAAAKLPELAAGYIAGSMALTDIKAHLTTLTAKLDRVEIDTKLGPNAGAASATTFNVAQIYADRNRPSK